MFNLRIHSTNHEGDGQRSAGRLLCLAVFVVFAVGAVASASASADSCTGGTHWVFCNDNNETLLNETVLGTYGTAIFASHLGGTELKFECSSGDFEALLEHLGGGTGLILFLGCKETAPAGCSLSSTEVHVTFTFQVEGTELATFTGNKNGTAHELFQLTMTGCSIAGSYTVTGTQMVELRSGGVSKVEHEIVAKKSQSNLKLGVETMSFSSSTANTHLGGTANMANLGLAWLIMSGE
jgi:hypothetical protein